MKIDVAFVRSALRDRTHRPVTLVGDESFAAVAIVLREREDDAAALLIRRAEHDGDPWSGHMAFPGGRRDPADRDLLDTALRETEEEVGLRLRAEPELLGRLDDMHVLAGGRRVGLVIAPYVFAIDTDPELVPNAAEVEEVVWAPLSVMARGAADTTFSYGHEGRQYQLPAYDVGGRIVWGLTHRMLGSLFAVLDEARRQPQP
jgi:8-oxo-dGTP pyrophosphatase MutT (NUDIX family)